MSADDNKALVRRYIEIGWSTGDLGVVRESVTANYYRHQRGMPFPVETGAALEELVGMYRKGLPDLEVGIDHIVAEADLAATRVTARAPTRENWLGSPPPASGSSSPPATYSGSPMARSSRAGTTSTTSACSSSWE